MACSSSAPFLSSAASQHLPLDIPIFDMSHPLNKWWLRVIPLSFNLERVFINLFLAVLDFSPSTFKGSFDFN